MDMRSTLLCSLIAPLLFSSLVAQQPKLRLDFPGLAARASESNDVSLDGAMLQLGAAFLNNDDDRGGSRPDARALHEVLSKLKGVYVRTFEFKQANTVSDADLDTVRSQLKGTGWSRIVAVHDPGETDEVYVCTDAAGTVQGLAVLVREPRELDVVNIVGSITPAELKSLSGQFGIPKLDLPAKPKGGA